MKTKEIKKEMHYFEGIGGIGFWFEGNEVKFTHRIPKINLRNLRIIFHYFKLKEDAVGGKDE